VALAVFCRVSHLLGAGAGPWQWQTGNISVSACARRVCVYTVCVSLREVLQLPTLMDINFVQMALRFQILFWVMSSLPATANYNYEVLDQNSSTLADLGGRVDFQLAVVGRQSGQLFVAARDRLLQFDSELNLLRSVSVVPRCRRNKQHRQLVTPCSLHNNATLLTLLPTTTSEDTGHTAGTLYIVD